MKNLPIHIKLILFSLFIILYSLFFIHYSKPALAQESTPEPTPRCACSPGSEKIDCYTGIPKSWCCRKGEENNPELCDRNSNKGKGAIYRCNDDCMGWSYVKDTCTDPRNICKPDVPQITPVNYSFEDSVGDFNEYVEGRVHSGTRDQQIEPSDPNNYAALTALFPADTLDELRVNFVKNRGDYDVVLADGKTKINARKVWNDCTDNGDLNNWRQYQEQLHNCPNWGFVPTTYRRLATEPTPKIEARDTYFKDINSPFVLSWDVFSMFQWVFNFFRNLLCENFGLFCLDLSLPLQNPKTASGWMTGKPNIPRESSDSAQLLRQVLLPQNLPLGNLPNPGGYSYFNDTAVGNKKADPQTIELLRQTGQAAQQTSAEGGLFRIFQPRGLALNPALCNEFEFNPPEGCASDFYFTLANASPGTCYEGNFCYTDTPDYKTFERGWQTDDRPLYLRTFMNFTKQSFRPIGIGPADNPPGPVIPPGSETLDFIIPYMNKSVQVINPDNIKATVKTRWPNSKVYNLWDFVVGKSIDAGVNPAFTLTIWIEESGASGVFVRSPFGCFPGGDDSQNVPFDKSLDCFLNFTSQEHPGNFEEWVRYFCGPGYDPICSNNPNFISGIKDWYSKLVPPGSYGELIPK